MSIDDNNTLTRLQAATERYRHRHHGQAQPPEPYNLVSVLYSDGPCLGAECLTSNGRCLFLLDERGDYLEWQPLGFTPATRVASLAQMRAKQQAVTLRLWALLLPVILAVLLALAVLLGWLP